LISIWLFERTILKSLPTSLCQREEKYFPILTKGDGGGLDHLFKALNCYDFGIPEIPELFNYLGDGFIWVK